MPKSAPPVQTPPAGELPGSYEEAVAELEQLVNRMESGELGLEASLGAYRRGAELVKYCQTLLERIEQQVKVLEGDTLKPLKSGAPLADE